MEHTLIVKIKHNGTLRRVSFLKQDVILGKVTFADLDKKIRELHNLLEAAPLMVTYTDNEGDVVTMGNTDDLQDAVVLQKLNPLRLVIQVDGGAATSYASSEADREAADTETTPEPKAAAPEATPTSAPADAASKVDLNKLQAEIEERLKAVLKNASGDVHGLMGAFEPFLRAAPAKIAEVMEAAQLAGLSAEFEPIFSFREPQTPTPAAAADENTSKPEPAAAESKEAGKEEPAKESAPAAAAGEAAADRAVHRGVQCDVCQMCPIVGPRYKSTVKTDYDLCRACYAKDGVEEDYNRIEKPLFRPRPHPFWGHPANRMGTGFGGPQMGVSFGGRPFHMGRSGGCGRWADARSNADGKLDARFVKDVTIFDGTELVPGQGFTKIWRLRNSGSLPWPQQTQLVHVGGDQLGAADAVSLELPEEGLAPGEEVEASVDLVAPSRPGRYVCHWRLLAPGGPKFGHRVWALIQVVPADEPSPQMAESVAAATVAKDKPSAPPTESVTEAGPPPAAEDKPLADLIDMTPDPLEQSQEVEAPAAPAEEAHAVTHFTSQPGEESSKTENTSVGGFSLVDHPNPPAPVDELAPPAPVPVESASAHIAQEATIEDALVAQLEAMGFTDRALNVEVLQANGLDLQRTLDELVAAAEWDPMMEELEEMGFYDKDVNRRLMFKNKGSVKRVVKELVQMYKDGGAASGQQ